MSISIYEFLDMVDPVILNMTDFDMILDMTWLFPYYVVLNYNAKTVTLEILSMERLEWKWVYKTKLMWYLISWKDGVRKCRNCWCRGCTNTIHGL